MVDARLESFLRSFSCIFDTNVMLVLFCADAAKGPMSDKCVPKQSKWDIL